MTKFGIVIGFLLLQLLLQVNFDIVLNHLKAQSSISDLEGDSLHAVFTKSDIHFPTAEIKLIVKRVNELTIELSKIQYELDSLNSRLSDLVDDSLINRFRLLESISDSLIDTVRSFIHTFGTDSSFTYYVPPAVNSLIFDCDNLNVLDSIEKAADEFDIVQTRNADISNRIIQKEHSGHLTWLSVIQNSIYCEGGSTCPVCYECQVCGHFDLFVYHPLDRMQILCSDRIYQIPTKY